MQCIGPMKKKFVLGPRSPLKNRKRCLFSRESDSRIANVRLSVCHRNPSASQNCSYRPLSLSTIEPIDHWAYWPSSLSTIKPINHQAYQPSSLSTIKPIDHQAYWPLSQSTIEPTDHWAYQPSSLFTLALLSRLLSLLACLDAVASLAL